MLVLAAAGPLCAQISVGREAPNFSFTKSWNLMEAYNELETLRGRPVIVEHWATWCPPCVKNVPHMNELHDLFSPQGLTIVAVSAERASAIDDFVRQHGLRYPVVQSANAGRLYQADTIPMAFLVDVRGKVIWAGHPAELTVEDIERYFGLKPARLPGSSFGSTPAAATVDEGSGKIWFLLIGGLALVMVGALGWFWWKTSDRSKPAMPVYAAAYPVAPPPPTDQPPGQAQQPPADPTAAAAARRPASSTAVAPLLAQAGKGPSSGTSRTIKLTPSGRFPTVPYAAGGPPQGQQPEMYPEVEPEVYPEAFPQPYPQQYPQPNAPLYPQPLQPDPQPPAAPPGKPIQFRPFNAGGRQQ